MVSFVEDLTGYSLREWFLGWFFKPKSLVSSKVLLQVLCHSDPSVRQRGLDNFGWSCLGEVLNDGSLSVEALGDVFGFYRCWSQVSVDSVDWDQVLVRLEGDLNNDVYCTTFSLFKALQIISPYQGHYGDFVLPEKFLLGLHGLVKKYASFSGVSAHDSYPKGHVNYQSFRDGEKLLNFYAHLLRYSSLSEESKLQVWLDSRGVLLKVIAYDGKRFTVFHNARNWGGFPVTMLVDVLKEDVLGYYWVELFARVGKVGSVSVDKLSEVLCVLLKDLGVEEDLSGLPFEWLVELYDSLRVKEVV